MTGRADKAAPPAPSKQRLRLWLRLLRTTRHIELDVRERLRTEFNTTLPRFDVLAAVYRAEAGITMTALSRALMVSNGNVTGIVDRLVADGLLLRTVSQQDRRATQVRMTPKGRKAFADMARAHEDWIWSRLGSLGEAETDRLIAALDQLEQDQGART